MKFNLRNIKECSLIPMDGVEGKGTLFLPLSAPLSERKFKEMFCYCREKRVELLCYSCK